MNHSFAVFLQCMRRDWYTYCQRNGHFFINYYLIYPLLFSYTFCYIQPTFYFGQQSAGLGSTVFIGHSLIIVLVLAFNFMLGLLFDFEHTRFIDYQITLLPPSLLIVQRILFRAMFSFILALPFFPLAKFFMHNHFITTQTSWPMVFCILFLSTLCCCAYMQCAVCIIPNARSIRRFWMRVNFILITLGGLFVPWRIMAQFSPLLGYIALCNPLLYITEGLRHAILGGQQFLPAWLCALALIAFSCVFTLLALFFFKKRTDHI